MRQRWIAIIGCMALSGLVSCSLYFEPGESGSAPSQGDPDVLPTTPPTFPGPNGPDDPDGSTGWVLQDFATSDGDPACDGQRLVRFAADYQAWVGAVLCGSAERYKLYMSQTQRGTYHQIADYAGHGQDHCELVNPRFLIPNEDEITSGGCAECAVGELVDVIDVPVFARARFGESFEQVTSRFWADLSTTWYECGVALRGADRPPQSRWLPLEFQTHDNTRYCDGKRFVHFSQKYDVWVGAELCDDAGTTYKLYMSDESRGTYHEIADFSGHGQDHCELLDPAFRIPNDDDVTSGGCRTCAVGGVIDVDGIPVFARSRFGEPFTRVSASFWGDLTTPWYRCGATIR